MVKKDKQSKLFDIAIKMKHQYNMPIKTIMKEIEKFENAFHESGFVGMSRYSNYRRGWMMRADYQFKHLSEELDDVVTHIDLDYELSN